VLIGASSRGLSVVEAVEALRSKGYSASKQLAPKPAPPTEPRWRAWVVSPRRGTTLTRGPTGCKGDLLSRSQCRVRPDTDARNALKGTLPPAMGTTCGRREREADAGNEEERSSPVPAVCNGGRHPGPRDADSLRGLSEERGPWSVRRGCVGLVPCSWSHRRQQVSSGRMRRGTSSACARRTHSSW
jgi:hypothetical protein